MCVGAVIIYCKDSLHCTDLHAIYSVISVMTVIARALNHVTFYSLIDRLVD